MNSSSCSAGSHPSDHSNILSLSSNRSESVQVKENTELSRLKQKLQNLFGVQSDNIQDLYLAIENKYSNKFVQQTLTELNSILSNLGNIKKNNREMAKLVTSLGIKLQDKTYDKQQNHRTTTSQSQRNVQTNQTSTSYEEYHFEYHPVKPLFSPQNPQFHATNSYRQFQMNNKKYEQKIMEMLNELGNIKAQLKGKTELKSKKQIEVKPATNKIKNSEPQPQPQLNPSKLQESKQSLPSLKYKSMEAQKSLIANGQNQKSLYSKANQISKRLQQIKSKIQGIKTQSKDNQPFSQQLTQTNQENQRLSHKKPNSKQKSVKFQKVYSNQSSSQNQLSMGAFQQTNLPVFERPAKKKSILDEMKNVESKMIISEKKINDKETLIDVFNGVSFQDNEGNDQEKNEQTKDEESNKNSQNTLIQKSTIKQVIISYSNMSNKKGQNTKNLSFHNTSIMNPHYVTKNRDSQIFDGQRKYNNFQKKHFVQPHHINVARNNNSQERLDNRSYSKQNSIKLVPSQTSLKLIQQVRPVQRLQHSQSGMSISLNNLNKRLENAYRQESSNSLHQQQQRYTHPLILLNAQNFNYQVPPQMVSMSQPRLMNPFENLNQDLHQKNHSFKINPIINRNNSFSYQNHSRNNQTQNLYQNQNRNHETQVQYQNQNRNHETSGINISVMKPSVNSTFEITLGKPTGQMRDSSYSKESSYSRDSKKGRGVRLSNEFD